MSGDGYMQMARMFLKKRPGVDDMVLLRPLDNETIVSNLEQRFKAKYPYCFINNVLISTNPYTSVPMYSPEVMGRYRTSRFLRENPPHVFSIGQDAYRTMLAESADQAIIITGESGSGKTEASKKILEFLVDATGHAARAVELKDAFLISNPLLEALGNAQTLLNDNSSRFGRYTQMQFDYDGQAVGGMIHNYLLEKSRVTRQHEGERNFHIFYQLLAGADDELLAKLRLTRSLDDWNYLRHGNQQPIPDKSDAEEWAVTCDAMTKLGLSDQVQQSFFSVLAAVLHIGNVTYVDEDGGDARVAADVDQAFIGDLLGVSSDQMNKLLVMRSINASGDQLEIRLGKQQAQDSRDALARGLYGRLFDWLVGQVNKGIAHTGPEAFVIGFLDVYGFEILPNNGFDQLLINYCNERLQQIFIELTLRAEQAEYESEGVEWSHVDYINNEACVQLLEQRPFSIIALLAEETVAPGSSDERLLAKFREHLASNKHFVPADNVRDVKEDKTTFSINHYAGAVKYQTRGMLERNKDWLHPSSLRILAASERDVIQEMFADVKVNKKRPDPVGVQFQNQVASLMRALYACTPHYVRCIKPNMTKSPEHWDTDLVNRQVRYLGLLENIRVRSAGFSFRQEYSRFLNRYKMLHEETWPSYKGGEERDGCVLILNKAGFSVDNDDFCFGKTKLFIRSPETIDKLEKRRDARMEYVVKLLQKSWRAFRVRKYSLEIRAASLKLYQGKKHRRRNSISQMYFGDYLHWRADREVMSVLENYDTSPEIVYAARVIRVNQRMRHHERNLVITNTEIYNFNGKTMRRRMSIKDLSDMYVSRHADNYFVLRFSKDDEYDYIACAESKTEVLVLLSRRFQALAGAELPIHFVDELEYTAEEGKTNKVIWTEAEDVPDTLALKHNLDFYKVKPFVLPSYSTLEVSVGKAAAMASFHDFASIVQYIQTREAMRVKNRAKAAAGSVRMKKKKKGKSPPKTQQQMFPVRRRSKSRKASRGSNKDAA